MRVAFRVDASLEIGTGHVMRCLALAEALRSKGGECSFICRPHIGNLIHLIRLRGFHVEELRCVCAGKAFEVDVNGPEHAGWLHVSWQADAAETLARLREKKWDWIIIDHYAIDFKWETCLRETCHKLMVIDDLADRRHDCDLLLDPSVGFTADDYLDIVPKNCIIRAGPSNALLRSEFALSENQRSRDGKIRNVLIYLGSNDKENQVEKALRVFQNINDINALIILGYDHPYREAIISMSTTNLNIIESSQDMAKNMKWADLAIGASGGNALERCALGLPSIAVTTAVNQINQARSLQNLNAIRYLGDSSQVTTELWLNAVQELHQSPALMREMSSAAFSVVAGWKSNFNILIGEIIVKK